MSLIIGLGYWQLIGIAAGLFVLLICHWMELRKAAFPLATLVLLVCAGLTAKTVLEEPMWLMMFLGGGFLVPVGLTAAGIFGFKKVDSDLTAPETRKTGFAYLALAFAGLFVLDASTGGRLFVLGHLISEQQLEERLERANAGLMPTVQRAARAAIPGNRKISKLAVRGHSVFLRFADGGEFAMGFRSETRDWVPLKPEQPWPTGPDEVEVTGAVDRLQLPAVAERDFTLRKAIFFDKLVYAVAESKKNPGHFSLLSFHPNGDGYKLSAINVEMEFRNAGGINRKDSAFREPVSEECFRIAAGRHLIVVTDCDAIYGF